MGWPEEYRNVYCRYNAWIVKISSAQVGNNDRWWEPRFDTQFLRTWATLQLLLIISQIFHNRFSILKHKWFFNKWKVSILTMEGNLPCVNSEITKVNLVMQQQHYSFYIEGYWVQIKTKKKCSSVPLLHSATVTWVKGDLLGNATCLFLSTCCFSSNFGTAPFFFKKEVSRTYCAMETSPHQKNIDSTTPLEVVRRKDFLYCFV